MSDPLITPEELSALFSPDLNLSTDARALIAHVGTSVPDQDGWVEIAHPVAMRLIQARDERKLRRAALEADASGWIDYRPQTGKGHHPAYRYTPANSAGLKDSLTKSVSVNGDRLTEIVTLNAPVVDREIDSRNPSIVSPSIELSIAADAEAAIQDHSDLLQGCRGALRDYLIKRVKPENQRSYVQSVAGYLEGFGVSWRDASGRTPPREEWPQLMRVALNTLGTAEEKLRKWAEGDVENLKNKLEGMLRQMGKANDRAASRANDRRTPATVGTAAEGEAEGESGQFWDIEE